MRLLLIVTTFLIIYGSLFPFVVDLSSYQPILLESLFHFSVSETSKGDFIANILLFLPFGFIAIGVFSHYPFGLRLILVLTLSFILAFAVQVAQLVIPGRVPAGSDAILNLIGSAIGCGIGLSPLSRVLRSLGGSSDYPEIPVVLAVIWLLFGLAPFVPSIDLQLIIDNVKNLLVDPLNPLWIAQSLTMWLIVFHFLLRSRNSLFAQKNYLFIVALSVIGGFFIVGNTISSAKIIGGLAALPVWWILRKHYRPSWLALSLVVVLIGINYTPFELRATPTSFSWVPFSGSLSSNLLVNVLAMFKKVALYGSLIWLLTECRISLKVATITTAISLLASEYLQIFFVNTTPEITDSLLAVAIGIAFHHYQRRHELSNFHGTRGGPGSAKVAITSTAHASRNTRHNDRVVSARYLPGMDGLRAIAALAVFFVHFNQQVGLRANFGAFDLERLLANGNTGVALFFVLSGLLLSLPFWQAQLGEIQKPRLRDYAWRRAGRIIPAYYFCLFTILFVKSMAGASPSWNNIISHVLFVYNVSDWNILSLNQPFWTLAVEAQFYIILPILFLALRKFRASSAAVVIFLLIPALYYMNHWLVEYAVANATFPIHQKLIWPISLYLSGPNSFVLTYSTLGHLPHFLFGVLAARFFLYLLKSNVAWPNGRGIFDIVIALGTFAILLILATPIDDVLQLPHGRYNFPFIPLLLAIVVVSVPFSRIAKTVLTSRVIAWLGAISYGIYIFHYPVQKVIAQCMGWVDMSAPDNPLIFAATTLVATFTISQFSYAILEVPAMRWVKNRIANRATKDEGFHEQTTNTQQASCDHTETLNAQMSKNSTPPNKQNLDAREAGSTTDRTLQLNLHQFQSDYLQGLAREAGLDITETCAVMIAVATNDPRIPPEHATKFERLRIDIDQQKSEWVKVTVKIDNESWNALTALAAKANYSHSHALRDLLEQHAKHGVSIQSSVSAGSGSQTADSRQTGSKTRFLLVSLPLVATLGFVLWLSFNETSNAEFVVNPSWARNGTHLTFDHHTHTSYSDGALSPAELVQLGKDNGCDAIAITDHSATKGSASRKQVAEIQLLRQQHPDLLLFTGIELNMPSYGGAEHVNVIVGPNDEATLLRELGDVAELSIREGKQDPNRKASDDATLDFLRELSQQPARALITYNHPSRKVDEVEASLGDIMRWDSANEIFTAIEGAPGHQNIVEVGSYKYKVKTQDRWDPVVAQVGGVWDQLLEGGFTIWGAIASSDYHNVNLDKAPCAFSRIHVTAPEKSYTGVLNAMASGTFWADHGNILDKLQFSLDFEGLDQLALPGTVVKVDTEKEIAIVAVSIERGNGSIGAPLFTEIISNCASGKAEIVYSATIPPIGSDSVGLVPVQQRGRDNASCYFRARVRMKVLGAPDLMAYTNPIRIMF